MQTRSCRLRTHQLTKTLQHITQEAAHAASCVIFPFCHQNSCSLCFGMQVFPFVFGALHPESLFMEKRMQKTASLCHRKQELGLFGMQRIVFPCHHFPSDSSIRMQTLIDLVSFVHTKPWLLPEMDAGLRLWSILLYVSPLATRAVHQLWVACVLPCTWRAGRGIKPLRPNAQDLCMNCQYTGHTSAYEQSCRNNRELLPEVAAQTVMDEKTGY